MVDGPQRDASRRTVRSFVRRGGRVTVAQSRALENLWPRFGVAARDVADLDALFGRRAPRFMEIGFGMGDALATMAAAHPERDYLGIEVHEAGVGRLLGLAEAARLDNLKVLREDAVPVLRDALAPGSLDAILVLFPDPWPKKRHHKRRLVQAPVVTLFARCLRAGGRLHLATDWAPYAEQMLEVVEGHPAFRNCWGRGCYAPDPGERPVTKFQRRGERLGHAIHDLVFERIDESI